MATHVDLEHRALHGELAEVEQLARQGNFLAAKQSFIDFRRTVEVHLDQEETFTLPEFEQRTGDPDKVVPIMHAQHRGLTEALDRVSATLALSDDAAFCEALLELYALLNAHQETEERLLSPRHDESGGRVVFESSGKG